MFEEIYREPETYVDERHSSVGGQKVGERQNRNFEEMLEGLDYYTRSDFPIPFGAFRKKRFLTSDGTSRQNPGRSYRPSWLRSLLRS